MNVNDELPSDCVARIRAGDISAFEQLHRATHPLLHAYTSRLLGDASRAEELLQDLFFDLWRMREGWIVPGSVRAYLVTSVRNRALNLLRRDSVEESWAADEAHDAVRALHPPPPAPDTVLTDVELTARVVDAIRRLPARCALAMQLRWYGGLSHAEIATALDISIKGVEHQLARGLKRLRAEFAAD
ncbi:MAG TPA: sigma-70 family RNA polymerase sigma factor [Gemmatimonadaceae bacterium]|nr:sigma-70 family RNA polymerase sigma factor [Gemmatimonadaceae bacterium]